MTWSAATKDNEPRKVWDNAEARALIEETARITDADERQALFDQIEAMFRADVPMLPLYSGTRLSAARKGIEGYVGWSFGSPRAWGVSKTTDG